MKCFQRASFRYLCAEKVDERKRKKKKRPRGQVTNSSSAVGQLPPFINAMSNFTVLQHLILSP